MNDSASARQRSFDALFTADPDPWGFEDRPYEAGKRRATLQALAPRRFGRGLEVGCATGVLTAELARICDRVLAIDVSQAALDLAERNVGPLGNVALARAEVPQDWPRGRFDLIVLSEVLYFLSAEEVAEVARRAWESLDDRGVCLLVNWTGPNTLPLDGDRASEIFAQSRPWLAGAHSNRPGYRIHRLHKTASPKDTAQT